MLTNVYYDGFNLYYRALKDTEFRWLDLRKLAEVLFPDDVIYRICYFTALIKSRPSNPSQHIRQRLYLRALATLPDLQVYYGDFRSRIITRPLAAPVPGLPGYVEVLDAEEKGSDVNLATRLLVDGFAGVYEQAAVVSNDSDFASPIRYLREELGLRVVVVNPDYNNRTTRELELAATYTRRLRKSHLRRSQFPAAVRDGRGVIARPDGWG